MLPRVNWESTSWRVMVRLGLINLWNGIVDSYHPVFNLMEKSRLGLLKI